MIEARPRIVVETAHEGEGSVVLEFNHDPAAVELIVIPAPTLLARWQAFRAGYLQARARRFVL